jgi:predicted TIM-barrel fold metal-dependent hydrolase
MERADLTILDGDGHVIESDRELLEYLEPPHRGNPVLLGYPFFPSLDGYHRGLVASRLGIHRQFPDAQAWVGFLDTVGIENTVLYPTAGLGHGLIQDPEWAVALARAYNDWFTDRYYRVNRRLRGVAILPVQDVDAAVHELRRAVEQLGMVGAVLPANGGDLGLRRPLGHPDYWPLYAEAERLNCALAVHGAPSQGLGFDSFTRFAPTQSLEHPFAQMIQLTSMVFEGVFERFSSLRVAYLEAGTGWVPYMMDRLDRSYEAWAGAEYKEYGDWVRRRPSEYIASGRLFFSCEGGEESLRYAIERVGDQVLLYASDFPHETNVERAQHEIDELLERPDLSDQSKRNILHDNIQRFYQR